LQLERPVYSEGTALVLSHFSYLALSVSFAAPALPGNAAWRFWETFGSSTPRTSPPENNKALAALLSQH